MTETPLSGVAALADRRVDERRVALWMAAIAVVLAVGCAGLALGLAPAAPSEAEVAARPQTQTSARARIAEARTVYDRRRWALPLSLVLSVLSLGPIKRAFGFDRATPLAMGLWPALLVGGHLALGQPLSPTPIDRTIAAGLGVLGLGAFLVASALVVVLGSGPVRRRIRRHVATLGWSAAASVMITGGFAGFTLGAEVLSPRAAYLPVLFGGAATSTLVACAFVLASSVIDRGRSAASPPTGRT